MRLRTNSRHRGRLQEPSSWIAWAVSAIAALTASCGANGEEAPLPAPPPVVDVTMRDDAFEYDPRGIPSGRVVFRVRNEGRRSHELTFLVLPENFPRIDDQLRGETRRAVPTLSSLHPLRPGGSDAIAVDLAPGRYAVVSFLKASDGRLDALKGMASEFRVR